MKKSIYRFGAITAWLTFFLTYCSRGPEVAQGNNANAGKLTPNALTKASATITVADGGYINVGSTQLAIPQGAVAADTQITAELVDITEQVAGAQKLGKGIKLTPEGLQFLVPADLTICYEGSAVSGLVESTTTVYYKTDNNQLIGIAGNVNPATHCVRSHIEHFSSYIAVAQSQSVPNPAPVIQGANFLPTTPLAGIPLRVRTQINDLNAGGATGQVVSAFLNYRAVGAPTYTRVPLIPDTTDDTVTNRYFYLIPAAEVTTAGIQYFFEAYDNLNLPATTAPIIRTVPTTANGIQYNLTTTLNIASGFTRAITLQASDNAPAGPWRNISVENQNLSNAALGSLVRSGPSTIRLSTTGAGAGTITSTAGAFTASLNVSVIAGLLTHIEITDVNQVHLTGTYLIGTNQTVDFDAVGYDSYGNISTIKPVFSTTGGIGSMLIDLTGAHFTAGASATTGVLTATIAGFTDSLDFLVYVPPAIAATAPVDGATNVNYLGSNIAVTFTKTMDTSTLTTNTTTACSGSIQVSATNFADCVPMTSTTPLFFSGNALAIATPAIPLLGNTIYSVRVLATAKDTFGYPLAGTYTSPSGFMTKPDVTVPLVGTGIVFSNLRNHGMTLMWGVGSDDSTPVTSLQYKVVKDNASPANINTVALADAKVGADLIQNWTTNLTTKIINGLPLKNTPYHFAILVRDLAGNKMLYSPATQVTTMTTWEIAPSLSTGRLSPTTTRLNDGRVLVTGGATTLGPLSSAEIFDPLGNAGAGSFIATASLFTPRQFHTATLLPDGRVLITGGSSLSTAEIFDPLGNAGAGSFTTTASMSAARYWPTATLLSDGRVLITGGFDPLINGAVSSAEIFDPLGNAGAGSFTATASMSTPRYFYSATLLPDGRVLIAGGYNGSAVLSSSEIFDPLANAGVGSFTATGSMSTPRRSYAAAALPDGRVLVIGGFNGSTSVSSAEIFDPSANAGAGAYTTTALMSASRIDHMATLLSDGRVLIAGGYNGSAVLSSSEIFDPLGNAGAGTFNTTASMSTPRYSHATTLLTDGRVLVLGGHNGVMSLSSAEFFE